MKVLLYLPRKTSYKSVQVDEFWGYVGDKKKGKRWLIYAYAPETQEIIAYVIRANETKKQP